MHDSIVEEVLRKMVRRSYKGQDKYGTTLDRTDLTFEQWATHAQEEAMDFALYLEKMLQVSLAGHIIGDTNNPTGGSK